MENALPTIDETRNALNKFHRISPENLFRQKTIEEVASYTRFLAILKFTNRREVFDSGTKNSDFHSKRDRNSFLACRQSSISMLSA